MVKADDERLQAHARFLSDPPLWCWEIVDAASGAVVASSWQSDWQAYESPNEALREAARPLGELTRR